MQELLLATKNKHKVREIAPLLSGLHLRLRTLDDFPGMPMAEEDGKTLKENARKKALAAAEFSGLWTLADDTGLEVDALKGKPGIYSARFAGPPIPLLALPRAPLSSAGPRCDFRENIRKLLRLMKGVELKKRTALFRCAVALAGPNGKVRIAEGTLRGLILRRPRGAGGFGYDSVFFVPDCGKTLAEMSLREKNRMSHRALALRRIRPRLLRLSEGKR